MQFKYPRPLQEPLLRVPKQACENAGVYDPQHVPHTRLLMYAELCSAYETSSTYTQ